MGAIEDKTMLRDLIENNTNPNKAAKAITDSIRTLLDCQLCTLDEFLCLLDLDYKFDWPVIAGEIARKAEGAIGQGLLHPNDIKPWQRCDNYREEFATIANQNKWRMLHSAIDSIIESISARFQSGS